MLVVLVVGNVAAAAGDTAVVAAGGDAVVQAVDTPLVDDLNAS